MDYTQAWLVLKLKTDTFNIRLLHTRDKKNETWLFWFWKWGHVKSNYSVFLWCGLLFLKNLSGKREGTE